MGYIGVGNIAFIKKAMTAKKYIEVLYNNLPESAIKLRLHDSYHFQQDNQAYY